MMKPVLRKRVSARELSRRNTKLLEIAQRANTTGQMLATQLDFARGVIADYKGTARTALSHKLNPIAWKRALERIRG
jgi:hypothetical protein